MKWIIGALVALTLIVAILFAVDVFMGATQQVAAPVTAPGSMLATLLLIALVLAILGMFVPKDKFPILPAVLFAGAAVLLLFALANSGVGRWVGGTITNFERCLDTPSIPECRQPAQTNCPEEKVVVFPGQTQTYIRRDDCQNMFWSRQDVDTVIEAVFQGDDGECTFLWDASGEHPSYNGTVSTVTLTNKGDTPTSIWFAYR